MSVWPSFYYVSAYSNKGVFINARLPYKLGRINFCRGRMRPYGHRLCTSVLEFCGF